MSLDTQNIKEKFSIFKNQGDLIYLDSAATTQTPDQVVQAVNNYYQKFNANIHRGVHSLSIKASKEYAQAREKVADFINTTPNEIIFNSGATAGLNFLAQVLTQNLTEKDNVVLSRMEHHANLIPWQQAAKEKGFELRFIELTDSFELDMDSATTLIDENTRIVSIVHASNTLGTVNQADEIIKTAKNRSAFTIIDACQSIQHMPLDVKKLDCDFLVFSGHKLYGPTGIGVLYGKKEILDKLEPVLFGGDMINEVDYESVTWNEIPSKFEPGTPNIAGVIGLGAAIDFVEDIGIENIQKYEDELTEYAQNELKNIDGLEIIGPEQNRIGVISFIIDGIHHYDIGVLLDKMNIAVRTGHHCTQPLMKHLEIDGTVRISIGVYTIKEDIDKLVQALEKIKTMIK